jgi:hypothetical protein
LDWKTKNRKGIRKRRKTLSLIFGPKAHCFFPWPAPPFSFSHARPPLSRLWPLGSPARASPAHRPAPHRLVARAHLRSASAASHAPSASLSLSLPTGPARQPAPLTFLFFPDALGAFPFSPPQMARPNTASRRRHCACKASAQITALRFPSIHRACTPIKPRAGRFPSPFSRPRSSTHRRSSSHSPPLQHDDQRPYLDVDVPRGSAMISRECRCLQFAVLPL